MGARLQLFITIVLLFWGTTSYSQEKDSILIYKDKKGASKVSMSIYKFTEFYKAKKALDSVFILVDNLTKDIDSLKSSYKLNEDLSKKQVSLLKKDIMDKTQEIEEAMTNYFKKEGECFELQKELGIVRNTRNKFIYSTVLLLTTTILYIVL